MFRLLFAAAKTYAAVKVVEYVSGAFSAPAKRATSGQTKAKSSSRGRTRTVAKRASRPAARRKAA